MRPTSQEVIDTIVYFRRSDVISAGDVFSTLTYPKIDLTAGGSIDGEIAALNQILDLAIPREKQEGGTYIIPGHGRVADEADVCRPCSPRSRRPGPRRDGQTEAARAEASGAAQAADTSGPITRATRRLRRGRIRSWPSIDLSGIRLSSSSAVKLPA